MARILVTGATGTFGQLLVSELARNGTEVICLVRPTKDETPSQRLSKLWSNHDGVSVIGGNLTEPFCGVAPDVVLSLAGTIDSVIHSAASIKFDEDEATAKVTRETNIGGTTEILRLAKELRVPHFTYVSTAYVAGGAERFTENDLDIGQELRNPYEESKLAAEKLVQEWGKQNTLSVLVLRPSILVGRSTDGFTPAFEGFYGFYSGFALIKDRLYKRKTEDKKESTLFSTSIENGKLAIELPVVFSMGTVCTINLIQLDWVVDMAVKLVEKRSTGTYFLSHPKPLTIRVMTSHILGRFGYRGFSFREPGVYANANHSHVQKRIDALISTYVPYVSHEAVFVAKNLEAELGSAYVPPPKLGVEFLDHLIDYAESVNWGRH